MSTTLNARPEPHVVAVVLAAGRGRRLGGAKALLAWDRGGERRPLAAVHAQSWRFCSRVLIVTRSDLAAALQRHVPQREAEVLISERPDEEGPAGSLRVAAEAMRCESAMLVTPVDCPPVAPATARALIRALDAPDVVAVRPRHAGRGGHPVVLGAAIWKRYLQQARPLRDVLREEHERVITLTVDDAAVLGDIDQPSDLIVAPEFFPI